MDYFKIGQRIRKYRKEKGLSQEQLAEKLNISVTHVSHIETGNTKLSLPVFVAAAEVLGVCADDLLNDKKDDSHLSQEILHLFDSCSQKECRIILEIAKAAKKALKKF